MTAPVLALSLIRGRVQPEHLAILEARGYVVHRVGQAAYVHGADLHVIFGAWGAYEPQPAWADRLGAVSASYLRRARRIDLERRGRRFLRDAGGRFLALVPWYRVPPVQVYAFEPARRSLVDEEEHRAAERRAEVRERGWWT